MQSVGKQRKHSNNRIEQRVAFALLAVIVIAYGIIGGLYVARTPAWQAPDEPAHFNYALQLAWTGLPILEPGDWDSRYLDAIKGAGFSPESLGGGLGTIQYEDHQPPLYYLPAAVLLLLGDSNLRTVRLYSLFIGALVVIAAFAVVYRLFPAQPYLAVGTAAFVAFLPQHLAMMAAANNDGLAEFVIALGLLECFGFLRADRRLPQRALVLGVLLGAAFVTKATAYSLIFIIGAAVLLRARREKWAPARVIRLLTIIAIPALLIGGLWWARNSAVYGFPDVLGLRRHDAVVTGQPRTADGIAAVGLSKYLADGLQTTFQSFWGQFGWMGVVLPRNIITILVIFNSFALMGAGVAFVQFRALITPIQRDGLLVLALSALMAFGLFVYYNLSFTQFQGRYLFTGLIAFGFFYTTGLVGWMSLIQTRLARWLIVLGGSGVLAGFAVYCLFRLIIPNLPNFG